MIRLIEEFQDGRSVALWLQMEQRDFVDDFGAGRRGLILKVGGREKSFGKSGTIG